VLLEELKTTSLTPQDNTGLGTKRKREGDDETKESPSESKTKSIPEEKIPSTKKARVED
jgi:hypothetical protein